MTTAVDPERIEDAEAPELTERDFRLARRRNELALDPVASDRQHPACLIRPAVLSDTGFAAEVGVAAGMFPGEAVGFLTDMMTAFFEDGMAKGEICLIAELGGRAGLAYCRPVEATNGTHDLTMIAVMPSAQGTGVGRMLVARVEADLRARGSRLLLVNTSGSDHFEGARRFYDACGYERAARIGDYWDDGDDLIVFAKKL